MTEQGMNSSSHEARDAEARLEEIRARAKRVLVYPVTRDEALWLLDLIDALRTDNEHAYHAFRELTEGRP